MPAQFSNLPPETRDLMRQRYGYRESARSWRVLAILLAAIFLPWLAWSAWHHSNPEIRVTLISFQNETANSIEITYQVERRDPRQQLRCTLLARDIDKNVVGEIEQLIPASNLEKQSFTTTIPTRIAAVNAAVLDCRAARG
ncbi:MAG: hypothetical protein RLZZ581_355 [Actinomycetota bacterium]|jgi:hypothetical protein